MRSYHEYCAIAKSLDVVGDRWTLLIVRELVIRGPSRYTDLRNGLPGVATNLLAQRLRELEDAGVIEREEAPPPVATTLFRLTARGEQLRPVTDALMQWGIPLMGDQRPGDAVQSHWLTGAIELMVTDRRPHDPGVTIELRTGDEPIAIRADAGRVEAKPRRAENPDAVVTGEPRPIMGLLLGLLELGDAEAQGVTFEGEPAVLERIRGV